MKSVLPVSKLHLFRFISPNKWNDLIGCNHIWFERFFRWGGRFDMCGTWQKIQKYWSLRLELNNIYFINDLLSKISLHMDRAIQNSAISYSLVKERTSRMICQVSLLSFGVVMKVLWSCNEFVLDLWTFFSKAIDYEN